MRVEIHRTFHCFVWCFLWLCSLSPALAELDSQPATETRAGTNAPTLLIVMGASGASEFASNFLNQARLWGEAGKASGARIVSIGQSPEQAQTDHAELKQALDLEQKESRQALWIVLIGHGTFDGKEARFNLRGPDVSAGNFAEWLQPFRRPVVFIDTSAASAPFLARLSGADRIIVTATRSGSEQSFSRLGQYLAEGLSSPESDLDKDGQISVLELFVTSSARVSDFYKAEGRLASEHALLDDNGDHVGTPADWFRGVRLVRKPEGTKNADGLRAHQMHLVLSKEEQSLPPEVRGERDALELEVAHLREAKATLPEAEYFQRLDQLLSRLVQAYGERL